MAIKPPQKEPCRGRAWAMDPQPQPLLQGSNAVFWQSFSSIPLKLCCFLVWRAGCAAKQGVCAWPACSASPWRFTDRREIFWPCSSPAGQWPALNWKPSNNAVRAQQPWGQSSHSPGNEDADQCFSKNVIQEPSNSSPPPPFFFLSFFLFFFNLFSPFYFWDFFLFLFRPQNLFVQCFSFKAT